MANALSELGAYRVVPNVAVPSKTQLSLFSKKAVYFPDAPLQNEGNSGAGPENKMSASFSNQDPIHFVFDFSEGETFSLYGTEIRVPRENRFIATCDHLNFRLFVNPAFENYALKHVGEMDGALISGFHLLLETYPGGSTYKEVLENSFAQLKAWKAGNEKLRVHLEFGHFASREIANSVFRKFAGISDSIGMNEDELAMLHNLHGIPAEGILRMEAEAAGEAACKLASRHRLGKLFIHTREFVLAAFKPGNSDGSGISDESGISRKWEDKESPALLKAAEKNLEAMGFGLRCAGAYAASGRLEGREFVEKEASKLQESVFGRKQLQLFLEAFDGKTCGYGAFALMEGYMVCILPTLLSKSPITTVGLGDTLTAGAFLRGLELDVQT
jgi:ADP-dependent phosphofructokinase/glucokinase